MNNINKELESILSKIGIRKLFLILFLVFGSIITGIFFISSYKTIYSVIYKERIEKLKYVCDFAITVLNKESSYVKEHKKTLTEAQNEAINIINNVRFAHKDYVWITTYDGQIISHPMKNFIGINVKSYTDAKGYNFGKKLIEDPQLYGSAYIQYVWQKPGEKLDKVYPKVSYTIAFKDWRWIIGSGIYTDDITLKVIKSICNGAGIVIFATILLLIIFSYLIWAVIIVPVEELANNSLKLANNDLDISILDKNSNTEFGKLYKAFNKFVEFFKEKRNSEKKLSLILDNITDALVSIDNKGKIQSVNPAIKDIFNYNEEEIIGQNINLLTSPSLFEKNLSNEDLEMKNGKYNMLGIKKNEEFFPIELTINKCSYNNENLYIILIRDITEQKHVEKIKNEFVSVVSHELRTPLTAIRGALGLALSGVFPNLKEGKLKDLLDIAHNNSLRLINLINDILDIEKIEAGKMNFSFENININDSIKSIIEMNKPYADKFKVKYEIENNTDQNSTIYIDKNRFTQVITNLLSNATKFSPENESVIIKIETTNGNKVKISVIDKGRGIPESYKEKIFDKFTQADSSDQRQKGGTGLGLSICKKLVEEMGGNIGFSSEVNHGTTFYIEF